MRVRDIDGHLTRISRHDQQKGWQFPSVRPHTPARPKTAGADRRSDLGATYEEYRPEAGVHLLRSTVAGRILVRFSSDLRSVRNKRYFAQSTNSPGVLDRRMVSDARQYGMDAFALEVLDGLTLTADMSPAGAMADPKGLEALWREKLADVLHY